MTEKKNKDFMRLLDLRNKSEDDRREESGRSMVEMLGVLAIVGVLSVGGIAGYTYAMNKHYANELLNGASERAVLVSAQIVADHALTIDEFENETAGGKFITVEEFSDGGFGIKVSNIKDAVCQNVIKTTKETDIFIAKDDGSEVLNEMTESDCSGDNNSFWFVYENENDPGNGNCGASSECQVCNSETGVVENKADGTACMTSDGKEGECKEGVCKEIIDYTGIECMDYQNNSECGGEGSGYYCVGAVGDSGTDVGECQKAPAKRKSYSVGHRWYYLGPNTDWYSAYSWCKSQEGLMSLVTEIDGIPLNDHYSETENGPLYQILGDNLDFWTGIVKNDYLSISVSVSSDFEESSGTFTTMQRDTLCSIPW